MEESTQVTNLSKISVLDEKQIEIRGLKNKQHIQILTNQNSQRAFQSNTKDLDQYLLFDNMIFLESEQQFKTEFNEYSNEDIGSTQEIFSSSDNKPTKDQTESFFSNDDLFSSYQEFSSQKTQIQVKNKVKENGNQEKRDTRNKIKFSQYLINKYLNEQKLFSEKKKYYMFSDQVIDLDYCVNIYQKDKYLKEMSKQQLHKGLRFINQVIHRMDNKFIEIDIEYFPSELLNIDFIIEKIKSIGNKDLGPMIETLSKLWESAQYFKNILKQENENPLFQQHFEARQKFQYEKYQEIISQLNPNEMIYFVNYIPNNQLCIYESKAIGYSPGLYEVLAQNSYKFKDILTKNGCYDPRTQINGLDTQNYEASICLYAISQGFLPTRMTSITYTDIITCDDFIFPVQQTTDIYVLSDEYDKKHGLNFKSIQVLAVNTFKFLDEKVGENFKKVRSQQEEAFNYQSIEENNLIIKDSAFQKQYIEFFEKYYQDSIQDLYKYGNKWLKRCGYVDIPKKKNKNI